MTFKDIYNRIIPHWGNKLIFYDGKIIQNAQSEGFGSETLISLWDDIEKKVGQNNAYDMLMAWTMYQVFHRYAKSYFKNAIFEFDPTLISKSEIEHQYFLNLNGEDFKDELANYVREI